MAYESYTPLFSKIVHSSLWSESDNVRIVFVTMLALKDSNHMVWGTAFGLGKRANKDEAEVLEALKILESPDTKRIEKQPYDGRRIERVEGGWLILNGDLYRKMMGTVARRTYKTDWQRNARAEKKPKPLPGEEAFVKAVNAGAPESELDQLSAPKEKET